MKVLDRKRLELHPSYNTQMYNLQETWRSSIQWSTTSTSARIQSQRRPSLHLYRHGFRRPCLFKKDLLVAAVKCGCVYSSPEPSIWTLYPIYLSRRSYGVWSDLQPDEAYPASFCPTMERHSRLLWNSLVLFSKTRLFKNTWLTKEANWFSMWNMHPGGEAFLNKWSNLQVLPM